MEDTTNNNTTTKATEEEEGSVGGGGVAFSALEQASFEKQQQSPHYSSDEGDDNGDEDDEDDEDGGEAHDDSSGIDTDDDLTPDQHKSFLQRWMKPSAEPSIRVGAKYQAALPDFHTQRNSGFCRVLGLFWVLCFVPFFFLCVRACVRACVCVWWFASHLLDTAPLCPWLFHCILQRSFFDESQYPSLVSDLNSIGFFNQTW